MADIREFSEREEIEMLLPWYAMGTLDAPEAARVSAYLARHPEMMAQLKLIEAERQADVALNEAITVPAGLTPDRLLAKATPRLSVRAASGASGILDALASLFRPGGNPGMRWVAGAAAAVILAQAVAIGVVLQRDAPGYELASGDRAGATAGTFVLARLRDEAPIGDLVRVLREGGATIVDGPGRTGMMTLRIGPREMTEAQIAAAMDRLKAPGGPLSFVTLKGR